MNLSDADRRAILVHLEQIRAIVRGPVGAEPPMAGDVVEVAESYRGAKGVHGECGPMKAMAVDDYRAADAGYLVDLDGGVAQQAAATASRGIYAGSWCRYGKSCPHPNVCQLAPGGCTDRRDVIHHPV